MSPQPWTGGPGSEQQQTWVPCVRDRVWQPVDTTLGWLLLGKSACPREAGGLVAPWPGQEGKGGTRAEQVGEGAFPAGPSPGATAEGRGHPGPAPQQSLPSGASTFSYREDPANWSAKAVFNPAAEALPGHPGACAHRRAFLSCFLPLPYPALPSPCS